MTGADTVRAWLASVHGRVRDELMRTRLSFVVLGVIALGVVLHGASYVPMIDVHLGIASEPTGTWASLGRNGYLLDSPAMILLAHALGIESRLAFSMLALVVITLGVAWLVVLAHRHHGDAAVRLVAIAFFVAPIGAVLITWLGQPDPVTMAAAGTLVLARNPLALALAGVLLGFNHFEAGVPIVLASGVLLLAEGPARRRALDVAVIVLGLVAGKLALSLWQASNGQDPMSRLDYVLDVGWQRYVRSTLGNMPALVFSTFSLAWPLVVSAFVEHWQRRRAVAYAMTVAALLAAGVTVLSLDPTRVFALVSWPLVLFAVTRTADVRLAVWCLLLGIVIPRVIVWDGGVIASGFHRLLLGALG
jgi:hypothetical protein